MLFSFVVLPIAVAFATAVGLVRTNLAIGLICSLLAVALIAVGMSRHSASLGRLHRSSIPSFAVLVVLLPCLWMLFQAAPLPGDWLTNAVWSSASSALGLPITGSITVDTGATLLAFAQYWAALSMAGVVIVLAFDRRAAELTLYFLTFIAVAAAAVRIVDSLGYLDLVQHRETGRYFPGTLILSAVGIILASATEIRLRERLRSRRIEQEFRRWTMVGLAAGAMGLAICTVAVVIEADPILLFAGLFGAGVLFGIFVIRQWSLSAWGRAGVIAVGAIILLAFVATVQIKRNTDSATSPSQNQVVIDRMLSDAPALGSGAGTFASLLPIYREADLPEFRRVDVAAARITIEMGRTFLWISILALGGIAIVFARGGVTRGRDYVYASAGAGVIVAVLILMFTTDDLLSMPASIFISAVAGLAWTQSRSTVEDTTSTGSPIQTVGGFFPTENSLEPRVRLALLVGLILTIEAAWLLLAEQHVSKVVASPFVDVHSKVSIDQREALEEAATIAGLRGDLWAQSAFAEATLLLKGPADPLNEKRTRGDLTRALRYAPYRSDAWLTFALLAEKYSWSNAHPRALLKMAYYTGPNEINLIPPRLKAALRLIGGTADPELQDMIRGDVSLIFRRLPVLKPILADAYKTGSAEGRALAERLFAEFNPDYLRTLRNP